MDKIKIMKSKFTFIFLLINFCGISQGYGSYVLENDTLTESGDDILVTSDAIFAMSFTRCQPNAQICGRVYKFDMDFNFLWSLDLPLINISNENSLQLYNDSTLITVGRNNSVDQNEGFYHYLVNTDGEIIDFIFHSLPYELNIAYGSCVQNDVLYMYGTSREFLSTSGIDVDALIVTHELNTGLDSLVYFDYEDNFYVDIYDLQKNSDSTLVFISRRRNFDYLFERDYVIEEIQPDGSRIELYNLLVSDELGITNAPSLEVLSDGRMAFFKPDETYLNGSKTIRILDKFGNFLHDIILRDEIWPDTKILYNMSKTSDGGFILCGQYFDRTDLTETTIEFNGMLAKVNSQGDLVWIRQYRHEHNVTEEPTRSFLFDVKELPNGDIVATGNVENTTNDLWIIKTNSEGCFGDDDCGETTVSIEEEIFQKSYINVYPNPVIVGQDLQVEISSHVSRSVDYQLIDMQGRMVQSGQVVSGMNMVRTSGFASGSYVLNIDLGERGMESKVVIVK